MEFIEHQTVKTGTPAAIGQRTGTGTVQGTNVAESLIANRSSLHGRVAPDFPPVPPGTDIQSRIEQTRWENHMNQWRRAQGLPEDSDPEFTEFLAQPCNGQQPKHGDQHVSHGP